MRDLFTDAPVMKRSDAKALGLRHYRSVKACPAGHVAARYVSTGTCVLCMDRFNILWRASNPEKFLERSRSSHARNDHKYHEKKREWHTNNKDRLRELEAAHRKANRLQHTIVEQRRRARKLEAHIPYTSDQVLSLLAKQRSKCPYCKASIKRSYHIDHVHPLSKGGLDAIDNIQLLCPPCNLRKSNKHPLTYAREVGRLL